MMVRARMSECGFQQPINPNDRWKMAFATSHRGHEQLTVASMDLANSPGFFQARMERILASYLWQLYSSASMTSSFFLRVPRSM